MCVCRYMCYPMITVFLTVTLQPPSSPFCYGRTRSHLACTHGIGWEAGCCVCSGLSQSHLARSNTLRLSLRSEHNPPDAWGHSTEYPQSLNKANAVLISTIWYFYWLHCTFFYICPPCIYIHGHHIKLEEQICTCSKYPEDILNTFKDLNSPYPPSPPLYAHNFKNNELRANI